MAEQELALHYRYALRFLARQNLIDYDNEDGVALLFQYEEQGSLAAPLMLLEQQIGKSSLNNLLNNKKLVSATVEDDTPFIVANDLLYTKRSYLFEQELLNTLQRHLLPMAKGAELYWTSDKVLQAIQVIRHSNLLILTGGPGFGKTTALAQLLEALFQDHQERLQQGHYKVVLTAPTGRAASRMLESLSTHHLPLLQQYRPTTALTLHRLLGYHPTYHRCYYNEQNNLDADVVVVDESSMMTALFFNFLSKALKPSCKLIIIGDANQLPSIGLGAILNDLLLYNSPNYCLHHNIVTLTTCYRSDKTIFNLAQHALIGNQEAFYAALQHNTNDVLLTKQLSTVEALLKELYPSFNLNLLPQENLFQQPASCLTDNEYSLINKFFNHYNNFIILTPLKDRSPYSADELNKTINYLQTPNKGSSEMPYHGQPIMVSSNSPMLSLSNGDRGVILNLLTDHGERVPYACFEGKPPILLSRLSAWETAYVITIHKSQGSEFTQVAIVIPPSSGRVLSQKLLYTAITRAKEKVMLYKNDEELAIALNNDSQRYSGIAHFLLTKNDEF